MTAGHEAEVAQQTHTILIAGCGYVGRRAAETWVRGGHEVHAITRTEEKAEELAAAGIQPVLLDLSHPVLDRPLPPADTVLWAVGYDRSGGVSREQIWVKGLLWLLANLETAPQRFIYVSSTSVYGSGDGGIVDEYSPVLPVTEGGMTCVQAEQLLLHECRQKYPSTAVHILRFAGIYGPDRLLRRIEHLRDNMPLPGNPDHPLNLIHVDDAVRLIDRIVQAGDFPEIMNVVNTDTLSRREYYEKLASLVAAPLPRFESDPASGTRGGNRQVVTGFDARVRDLYRFNDVRQGLEDAVQRSDV